MTNEHLEPDDEQDEKQVNNDPSVNKDDSNSVNKDFPNKKKDYKVLHQDGSLADLPDQNVKGGGALEGTVGLGT